MSNFWIVTFQKFIQEKQPSIFLFYSTQILDMGFECAGNYMKIFSQKNDANELRSKLFKIKLQMPLVKLEIIIPILNNYNYLMGMLIIP